MLTDVAIRKAKPADKRYSLYDTGGLSLEVMPTGKRFWRLRYSEGGARRKLTLGQYPAVSLGEARAKRDELREAKARGIAPHEVLHPAKKPTFSDVALEWFGKHVEPVRTAGHAQTVRYRLEAFLFPPLGERPLDEIKAPELLSVLRPIEESGRVETARRIKQIFGQVARYGVATGACESDVSSALRGALAPKKPQHFSALTRPEDIKRLLSGMAAYQGSPVVRCALWFSLYTLGRPGEVRRAEWSEIDLEEAVWELPEEKMKKRRPHAVPLSRQAVTLLTELQPLTGRWRYVFPSARMDGRPMSENAVRVALRSMGFSNEEMTAHGFRSLGSTALNTLGYRADVIEAALAHIQGGVRGVYNRSVYWEERRAMMQAWADWLDALLTSGDSLPWPSAEIRK